MYYHNERERQVASVPELGDDGFSCECVDGYYELTVVLHVTRASNRWTESGWARPVDMTLSASLRAETFENEEEAAGYFLVFAGLETYGEEIGEDEYLRLRSKYESEQKPRPPD